MVIANSNGNLFKRETLLPSQRAIDYRPLQSIGVDWQKEASCESCPIACLLMKRAGSRPRTRSKKGMASPASGGHAGAHVSWQAHGRERAVEELLGKGTIFFVCFRPRGDFIDVGLVSGDWKPALVRWPENTRVWEFLVVCSREAVQSILIALIRSTGPVSPGQPVICVFAEAPESGTRYECRTGSRTRREWTPFARLF